MTPTYRSGRGKGRRPRRGRGRGRRNRRWKIYWKTTKGRGKRRRVGGRSSRSRDRGMA